MKRSLIKEFKRLGFTLAELLVVLAIISILAAIISSNFTQSKAKTRDARRVSDLGNLQLALSLFYTKCGQYPTSITNINYQCPTNSTVHLSDFIASIPSDPNNSLYGYSTVGTPPSDYELKTNLEVDTLALKDSTCPLPSGSGSPSGTVTPSGSGSTVYNYCVKPY